jgi:hypothetical protein
MDGAAARLRHHPAGGRTSPRTRCGCTPEPSASSRLGASRQVGPVSPLAVTRGDLTRFMADMQTEWKPGTCSLVYRALQQFFGSMVREEEIEKSPMEGMRPPHTPEVPVPVLADLQQRELLATCNGRSFTDRRDHAHYPAARGHRMPSGRDCRAGGGQRGHGEPDHPGARQGTPDQGGAVRVQDGAGARQVSPDAGQDPWAHTGRMWLSEKGRGPLSPGGIVQMLERRGRTVGIANLHAHQFRHTAAHRWGSTVIRDRPHAFYGDGGHLRCCAGTPRPPPMRERGTRTDEWRWAISSERP